MIRPLLSNRRVWLLFLLLPVVACGKVESRRPDPASTTPDVNAPNITPAPAELGHEDFSFLKINPERDIIWPTEAAGMLVARDYDAIESLAARMEAEKLRDTDGGWQVWHIPEILGYIEPRDSMPWRNLFGRLEEWNHARPHSPTAKACLGRALYSYSWSPFGQSVAEDSFQRAESLLEEAVVSNPDSMIAYQSLALIAHARSWPRDRRDQLFRNMMARFPDDYRVYCDYTTYLAPQWYGSYEELKKVEDAVVAELGESLGSQMYARMVWSVYLSDPGYLTHPNVSWPRMRKGFEEMMKRWPESRMNLNAFCRFACLLGDDTTARRLMPQIGDNFSWLIWKDKDHFERYRALMTNGSVP